MKKVALIAAVVLWGCAAMAQDSAPTAPAKTIQAPPASATPTPSGSSAKGVGGQPAPGKTIKFAVDDFPPFSFLLNGSRVGFDIDLAHLIAKEMGSRPIFVYYPDVTAIIQASEKGETDLSISGVSITADRRRKVDFSTPYFESGLRLLVHEDSVNVTLLDKGLALLKVLGEFLLVLVPFLLLFAFLAWLAERKNGDEDQFANGFGKGMFQAFYWATATTTSTGYGDITAKFYSGRVISMVAMVFGMLCYGMISGSFTDGLDQLRQSKANLSPGDIQGDVTAKQGSTSARYLAMKGLTPTLVSSVDEAIEGVKSKEMTAFMVDDPVALWLSKQHPELTTTGDLIDPQKYAVVLPKGSPRAEAVDIAILEIMKDGRYQQLWNKWFQ